MKDKEEKYINLVFQGGGVRGIAYAGALEAMPTHCKIHAVGGTSAGAIVAALLAIGIKGRDLREVLQNRDLFQLLEEAEAEKIERIRSAFADTRQLWERFENNERFLGWKLWRFYRNNRTVFQDIRHVWNNKGFPQSNRIRNWLDEVLQRKSFNDIVVDDLKIVAADVSERRYIVYDKQKDKGREIAEAVHASISIPIFFLPFQNGPRHLVDGGILSNFPSFLFTQGKYPTIGFRLDDITLEAPLNSTWNYLKGLLQTMVEAHDKERGNPPYFKSCPIKTPANIPSTKFSLTEEDVQTLYNCGRDAARDIKWDDVASATPVVSFYDPRPHETLEFSLSQAYKLWRSHSSDDLWVDAIDEESVFTVHVEQDWSTRYDRVSTLTVKGKKFLFMARLLAVVHDNDNFRGISLSELHHICEEILPDGPISLTCIPAFNEEKRKGFVVFYVPPVAEGQEPRRFHTGFQVSREFASSLAKGEPDHVSCEMKQRAHKHSFKLKFRFLIDADLPEITFEAGFGRIVYQETEFDNNAMRPYRVYDSPFAHFENNF
jgi:NTE family protein